ncbi:MAG: hypothetical protein AAB602_00975 [Patescibacteria group bacterium]
MPKTDVGNTQNLVAIEEIKDNTLVMKGGSLRQIIMVGGVNFALKSEMEQNILTQGYQNFLNSIAFPLQIVIHSRKVNIEKYLDELAGFQAAEASPLLKNQGEEYREFIRSFVQKNAIMEKSFFVTIPFTPIRLPTPKSASMPSLPLPFLKRKVDPVAQEKRREEQSRMFNEDLAQLKQRVNQVLEGLLGIGLDATILTNQQLIELFYNYYNPETAPREGMNLPLQNGK